MTTATFRGAVAEVAARAKEKLPLSVNGRIESAVKLVLGHDVTPQDDGTTVVGSSSDPLKTYLLRGQLCDCQDFLRGQAPEGWCQHRIAAAIAKRVQETLPAPAADDIRAGTNISPQPLPEAPASANVRLIVAGHEVQVTLRDQSEAALFVRLQALLKRQDIRPIPQPAPRSGGWKGRQSQGR
jgi:hypothetical protein